MMAGSGLKKWFIFCRNYPGSDRILLDYAAGFVIPLPRSALDGSSNPRPGFGEITRNILEIRLAFLTSLHLPSPAVLFFFFQPHLTGLFSILRRLCDNQGCRDSASGTGCLPNRSYHRRPDIFQFRGEGVVHKNKVELKAFIDG